MLPASAQRRTQTSSRRRSQLVLVSWGLPFFIPLAMADGKVARELPRRSIFVLQVRCQFAQRIIRSPARAFSRTAAIDAAAVVSSPSHWKFNQAASNAAFRYRSTTVAGRTAPRLTATRCYPNPPQLPAITANSCKRLASDANIADDRLNGPSARFRSRLTFLEIGSHRADSR